MLLVLRIERIFYALIKVKKGIRRIDAGKSMVYQSMLKNDGRRTTLVP